MSLKSNLIKSLETISTELEKSGKKETANFFNTTRESVQSECDGDFRELLELLRRLESSGAIVQYANFSYAEEQLWNAVYESASKWLESLERLS